MPNPLVSIVIPTYNRAYCVARTVDSALAQTYRNLEVLVVDDGSKDDTGALIREKYRFEPRVRYLYQENTGVSGARNTGMRVARGDYVAFLDSDDLWHPEKLALQVAVLKRFPDAGMVWTEMEAIDPAGHVVFEKYLRMFYSAYRWFPLDKLLSEKYPLGEFGPHRGDSRKTSVYKGDIYSQMLMGNLVHTSTVVLRRERRERVGFFNTELKHAGEDYDFHLRTCREGPVAFIDLPLIQYQRGFADRLTRPEHKIHIARNFLKTIGPAIARDRDRIHLPPWMIRHVLAEAHGWVGEEALTIGDRESAREHLWLSLRQNWRQPRVGALYLLACLPQTVETTTRRTYQILRGHARPATT